MENSKKNNKRLAEWAAPILIVLSLGLIGLGVFRGEASLVLTKAVNICLECIGIG